tara:strand:- start:1841 stop:2239 length:399 start_codon:yes stop_codon:yes gene_type:complete
MRGYAKAQIIGNVTRTPDYRVTANGTDVCKLSLAVNTIKDDGASFFDCTAFGKTAQTLAKYLEKGQPLFLEGRLEQDTWQDRETGKNRSKIGLIITGFVFLGKSEESSPATLEPEPLEPVTAAADLEDEVPF